jgi:hypothetical protein
MDTAGRIDRFNRRYNIAAKTDETEAEAVVPAAAPAADAPATAES